MAITYSPGLNFQAGFKIPVPDPNDTADPTKQAEIPAVAIIDGSGNQITSFGGGGATTIANGADVAEGNTGDAAYSDSTGAAAGTQIGLQKGLYVALKATGANSQNVQGDRASGTTDGGNPVKIGGVGTTTAPTGVTTGQRVNAWFGLNGQAASMLVDSAGTALQTANVNADGAAGFSSTYGAKSFGFNYNGSTWDRQRGDVTGSYVKTPPSTGTDRSITATTTSQQLMAANTTRTKFYVKNDSAVVVWINLGATAVASAGSGNIAIAANGGYFEFTGSASVVNIISASATAAVTAREF